MKLIQGRPTGKSCSILEGQEDVTMKGSSVRFSWKVMMSPERAVMSLLFLCYWGDCSSWKELRTLRLFSLIYLAPPTQIVPAIGLLPSNTNIFLHTNISLLATLCRLLWQDVPAYLSLWTDKTASRLYSDWMSIFNFLRLTLVATKQPNRTAWKGESWFTSRQTLVQNFRITGMLF